MPKNTFACLLIIAAFAGLLTAAAPIPDVSVSPKARNTIDAALKYLAARQNEDGSWDEGSYGRPTASTALAGLAFMSDGHVPGRGAYGENVSKALDYVLASAQPNGLLEYGVPHHAMYSHGYATLFLAEAWGMTARSDVRDKLKSAVDLIARTQNREGGWRYQPRVADADISVTIVQIVALRAAANAGIAVSREYRGQRRRIPPQMRPPRRRLFLPGRFRPIRLPAQRRGSRVFCAYGRLCRT